MVAAVEESGADAIGMSGLLVKSTLIMRENLEELNRRGLAHIPVILGGAALTRTYVERDLRKVYDGRLFYGKDAFEGLRTMDRLVEMTQVRRGRPRVRHRPRRPGPRAPQERAAQAGRRGGPARGETLPARSPDVATDNPLFTPPFLGSRVAKGMAIDDIAAYLNETALFRNQWGFRPETGRGRPGLQGPGPGACCASSWPRPRPSSCWCPRWPGATSPPTPTATTWSSSKTRAGTDELMRFTFPRQTEDPWLCISDFFRPVDSGEPDWASFQVVTMGSRVSEEAARLFAADEYQQYLYLHGLGVEMAEALAEYWHRRIREELGLRRRGRAHPDRPVPPEVPGRPVLVGLSGLPRSGGQRQGGRAARGRPDRRRGERGVPAPPRAVDHGHHLPPPAGQVLRGLSPHRREALGPARDRRAPGPLANRCVSYGRSLPWWRECTKSPFSRGPAAVTVTTTVVEFGLVAVALVLRHRRPRPPGRAGPRPEAPESGEYGLLTTPT